MHIKPLDTRICFARIKGHFEKRFGKLSSDNEESLGDCLNIGEI